MWIAFSKQCGVPTNENHIRFCAYRQLSVEKERKKIKCVAIYLGTTIYLTHIHCAYSFWVCNWRRICSNGKNKQTLVFHLRPHYACDIPMHNHLMQNMSKSLFICSFFSSSFISLSMFYIIIQRKSHIEGPSYNRIVHSMRFVSHLPNDIIFTHTITIVHWIFCS